ncbi:IS3 family transposase [Sinomonas terrae]|uniref:Integrase core domain-containing protein n=1 Tax=Sinomonas terrae TaxID=2908838 RepID=A0ABS9U0H4_9MICC|nr:IS3 family transposase [Sinomonas terrae]MCH6470204.1 integrase core domain-containing protein [Sinomonas terrae]
MKLNCSPEVGLRIRSGCAYWYNTERISTKLEGLSPVQYRAQALAA